MIAETLQQLLWQTRSNWLSSWQLSREKRGVKSTSRAHNLKNKPAWILPLQTAVPPQWAGITLDYSPGACFTKAICENPDGRICKLLLLANFDSSRTLTCSCTEVAEKGKWHCQNFSQQWTMPPFLVIRDPSFLPCTFSWLNLLNISKVTPILRHLSGSRSRVAAV